METRWKKTTPMLVHKIDWEDVATELDLSIPTLIAWRKSGDSNKNGAIDYAVDQIVNKLKQVQ